MRIPDYPAPDRALDGTEIMPIWEDGQQRSIPLQSLWSLAAAQNPAFKGSSSGWVLSPLTRLALAAVASPTSGQAAYLAEAGREGIFVFDTSNHASNVTADPSQFIYVAPGSDTTGASGAWIRQFPFNTSLGVLPSGTTIPNAIVCSGSGAGAGTTDVRGVQHMMSFSGTNNAQQVMNLHLPSELTTTAGTVTFYYGVQGYNAIGTGSSGAPSGAVTTSRGIEWHTANKSSNAQAIGDASDFFAADVDLNRTGANGTISTMRGFFCGNQGHASRVTVAAIGYDCGDMTGGAPITAAFRSQMGSGTGKWGLYLSGSAVSAMSGGLRIGDLTAPTEKLEVAGNMISTGSIKSNGTAGIGYATGAGGAASQVTSKTTGVEIDHPCGQITLNNSSLASNTSASFTLTNSCIGPNDVVVVNIAQNATADAYVVTVTAVASGSCRIQVRNVSAGSLSENLVLNFAVIKAVAA